MYTKLKGQIQNTYLRYHAIVSYGWHTWTCLVCLATLFENRQSTLLNQSGDCPLNQHYRSFLGIQLPRLDVNAGCKWGLCADVLVEMKSNSNQFHNIIKDIQLEICNSRYLLRIQWVQHIHFFH